MKQRILFFLFLVSLPLGIQAQKSPVEIKYTIMDLHALRYYPFKTEADSIIHNLINQSDIQTPDNYKQKTSINLTGNSEFIKGQVEYSANAKDFLYKNLIRPYISWIQYTALQKEDNREIALTLGLREEEKNENKQGVLKDEGIYGFIGKENVNSLINELFGDIDLFRPSNDVMFLSVKSPLAKERINSYRYFLSSTEVIDNREVNEIAFYPNELRTHAFTGYLYVTKSPPHKLVKASFTLSNSYNMGFIKEILFTQKFAEEKDKTVPVEKEYLFFLGEEVRGNVMVDRIVDYTGKNLPLTAAEKQVEELVELSSHTRAYNNLKTITRLLLTDHFSINGERGIAELGPVSQMLSYNKLEGFRTRLGGNTILNLNKQWLLGGYAAYGFKDKEWKYRGDIIYSFLPKDRDIWEFPKRLLSVSYVKDLSIPGEDLLTTKRDFIFYSLSHEATRKMSLQKLLVLDYEQEFENHLSFKIGGRYLNDKPVYGFEYITRKNGVNSKINDITSGEFNFALRYAPKEVFIQTHNKRRYIKKGDFEINIRHRIGLKIFDSDYTYHISDIDAYKEFAFPSDIGKINVKVMGRKVWSRLPFPFLFVSGGNQSYVFKENDYNLMNYSEFVTDNFIAGNMNVQFNWSPVKLFAKNNKIKTNMGVKALYGPMSDKNNPDIHPELFIYNEGIKPLGDDPYLELNFGFSNILKFLQVEWVQRLTYLETDSSGKKKNKGSIFFNASFAF